MTNPSIQKTSEDIQAVGEKARGFWSHLSYTTRVTLAFALIAAMTALISLVVLSFVWEQHFQTYTRDNMVTTAQTTAQRISEKYVEVGGWTADTVATAAYVSVTYPGIGILVVDNRGVIRYNSTATLANSAGSAGDSDGGIAGNNAGGAGSGNAAGDAAGNAGAGAGNAGSGSAGNAGAGAGNAGSGSAGNTGAGSGAGSNAASVETIADLQNSLIPTSEDQSAVARIMVGDYEVGVVRVWVYGSDTLLRQTDQEFRDNSYQAMAMASILAILVACCIGFFFARNLVRPINRMTSTAKAIKEGDLSARTGLTGEDEIARLGETFDAMAASVEKEREQERRLTTDVAHELRTPLMAISSTVEAMIDGVFEPDEERLATVNSEVERLSRLVNALLKLSKLESRAVPMKQEVVNVGELIETILSTHEAFVTDSGLTMTSELESDVFVKGDPDMIRQATANLISNAVRYTPEGGHITVRVKKGELMASIAVEDTGIGLTPEEAKMVFSRFWRADAGRTRASGGLGIGLSVVKEIVDQHKGWVQVEGKKDEGSRFTIHIPLFDKEREKQEARDAQRKKQRAARTQKKK